MLKYCIEKWDQNKKILEEALSNDTELNSCDYAYLVRMVVRYILNENLRGDDVMFAEDSIEIIDHGDYQGCQLFVVVQKTYHPAHWECIIGYQDYGSCSGCDTLLNIQGYNWNGKPSKEQLKDYMALCKDIVCSFVRPFKGYEDDLWVECEV